jgi:hypothetical protein
MYVPTRQSWPYICDERRHQSEVQAFDADQDKGSFGDFKVFATTDR